MLKIDTSSATGATLAWSKTFPETSAYSYGLQNVATDAAGNVYVAGGRLRKADQVTGMFVAKYKPDGTQVWQSVIGSKTASCYATAIGVSATNDIYVAGRAYGDIAAPFAGNTDVIYGRLINDAP